jgi:hypothetical protein
MKEILIAPLRAMAWSGNALARISEFPMKEQLMN